MSKAKFKIAIDFLMTIVLLFLMTYQITGQELHEWFGIAMLVLFVLHNWLNRKWYSSLFKGRYRALRIFQTMVNIGTLVSMLCLGYSGIVMSQYVFGAFDIKGPMATARLLHMAASFWGFVLMSLHLGMHWGRVITALKIRERNNLILWALRILTAGIAGYGFWCFIQNEIPYYLVLQRHFVFYDFEKSTLQVVLEYMAMMVSFVFSGYYITKIITKLSSLK